MKKDYILNPWTWNAKYASGIIVLYNADSLYMKRSRRSLNLVSDKTDPCFSQFIVQYEEIYIVYYFNVKSNLTNTESSYLHSDPFDSCLMLYFKCFCSETHYINVISQVARISKWPFIELKLYLQKNGCTLL